MYVGEKEDIFDEKSLMVMSKSLELRGERKDHHILGLEQGQMTDSGLYCASSDEFYSEIEDENDENIEVYDVINSIEIEKPAAVKCYTFENGKISSKTEIIPDDQF